MLFSATFNADNKKLIKAIIPGDLTTDFVAEEALKLEGVKLFRIATEDFKKAQLINEVYTKLGSYQTMIFAN